MQGRANRAVSWKARRLTWQQTGGYSGLVKSRLPLEFPVEILLPESCLSVIVVSYGAAIVLQAEEFEASLVYSKFYRPSSIGEGYMGRMCLKKCLPKQKQLWPTVIVPHAYSLNTREAELKGPL